MKNKKQRAAAIGVSIVFSTPKEESRWNWRRTSNNTWMRQPKVGWIK